MAAHRPVVRIIQRRAGDERVAWAPCGTLLAATSFDATCCVWRRSRQDDAWEILATLEGHENEVKGFTQRP